MIRASERRHGIWCLGLGIIVLLGLNSHPNDNAAGPWCIIVYGDLVPQRALMTDFTENQLFLGTIETSGGASSASLSDRPYAYLALYWGLDSATYARKEEACAEKRPQATDAQGRFYPARGSERALVLLSPYYGLARPVSAVGLEILAQHGVPTRVDQ